MDGVKIIDPVQYSVAWLILAALCLILIVGLTLAALRLTRYVVERKAYRKRPDTLATAKSEYLRAINSVGERHEAGEIDAREAHRELESILRAFVVRVIGLDARRTTHSVLKADTRTAPVGAVIEHLHEPGYARDSSARLRDSMRQARAVIRSWS